MQKLAKRKSTGTNPFAKNTWFWILDIQKWEFMVSLQTPEGYLKIVKVIC
jgi:hypothetical protein